MGERDRIGVIYGTTSTRKYEMACSSMAVKLGDYVMCTVDGRPVLGRIDVISSQSSIDFSEASAVLRNVRDVRDSSSTLSATVTILGMLEGDEVLPPHRPPLPGSDVYLPDEKTLEAMLGLASPEKGAYVGLLLGAGKTRVHLDINRLIGGHTAILAKTGYGKSYAAGVLIEELVKKNIPVVILDPHGEYSGLMRPNIDEDDVPLMAEFSVEAHSYGDRVTVYSVSGDGDKALPLRFSKVNLDVDDISDFIGLNPSGVHLSMLYKAVNTLKDEGYPYSIRDIIYALEDERNNARYTLINQLEKLDAMPLLSDSQDTPPERLVTPGKVSIVDLKGAPPHITEVAVTRLMKVLYDARKEGRVLPFMLLAEEAHNFCPQGGSSTTGAVMRTIATEGRKFGLGLCVITQRPARVDKNVLSQCATHIILRVTNPNDLKAITASVEGLTTSVQGQIQQLPRGTALIVGAGINLPIFVRIRPRETAHGGKGVTVI